MAWKIYLHDWAGATIGEVTDARNLKINAGLNKNSSMTFETTLLSPMGQQLADRDFSLISVWRDDILTGPLGHPMFSGMVFTTEETGEDDIPTIAVSAVGPYWQMSRRVANNSTNKGRSQEGVSATDERLYLFVADTDNNRISVFNAKTGGHVTDFGSLGSGPEQFNSPTGVAVSDDSRSLYVADMDNHQVTKFVILESSPFLSRITSQGGFGSGDNNLNQPYDVAVDNTGNVWVTDIGNNRVVKYNSNLQFLAKFRPVNSSNVARMNPRGISADSDGFIWVADIDNTFGNESWWRIDTASGTVTSYTNAQTHREVIRDRLNNYYFIQGGGDLWKNSTGTNSIKTKIHEGGANADGRALALSDDGQMFLSRADNANSVGHIAVYDSAGILIKQIGSYGTGTAQLKNPRGVALARVGSRPAIQIARDIIDYANTESKTWLDTSIVSGIFPAMIYLPPNSLGGFKKVSEVVEELSSAFEWKIIPKFTTHSGQAPTLGTWYAAPTVGSIKSDTIAFEYGTGRYNADRYAIKRSLEGLATRASYPSAENIPYAISGVSSNIGEVGLFEDVLTGNVTASNLRRRIVETALQFRDEPRMMVEITPARSDQTTPGERRVPIYLPQGSTTYSTAYDVGDVIGIEIVDNGYQRLEPSEARIYDITIEVDENGKETAHLNLYFD